VIAGNIFHEKPTLRSGLFAFWDQVRRRKIRDMSTFLEIPKLPSTVVLSCWTLRSQMRSSRSCAANDFARLERTREGKIVVNAPAGGDTSSSNGEITAQLRYWWKEHRKGRVFDSSAGFFLPDGSVLNPDAAYATTDAGTDKGRQKAFPPPDTSFCDRAFVPFRQPRGGEEENGVLDCQRCQAGMAD
jgi:hypothetical protein